MKLNTQVSPSTLFIPNSGWLLPGALRHYFRNCWSALLWVTFALLTFQRAEAGTWSSLPTAPGGVNLMILMSDGTLLVENSDTSVNQWYKYTPDIHGSYVNGTWSTGIAQMNFSRYYFSSQLLTNGNLYVAGGEYGTGGSDAEIYNPLLNTWTLLPHTGHHYSDAISEILPNGNVLQWGSDALLIYNVSANSFSTAATPFGGGGQGEASWVKLANDSILTIDGGVQTSEHYIPSANQWIQDPSVPVQMYGYGSELGGAVLLPNGKAFFIGGTDNTTIYTPNANPSLAGTWATGPTMPNGLGAVDAPCAMMVNGKVLMAIGPTNGFNAPTSFYEYDPNANSFTQVNGPNGLTENVAPFVGMMLCLPDGSVLYSKQGNSQIYQYVSAGSPLAAGMPVINNITQNADGTYQLTGTGLNGISEGAAYGDDAQMNSDYPLVRMTNSSSGNIYYARTFGWNSTSVQTGSRVVTTEFSLPASLPLGTYSLVAVANGFASDPVQFTLSAATGVTFFQNVNYGGTATTPISAGSYTLSQLQTHGFVNDWASSLQMPTGWTVTMYADDNFGGTAWTMTANTPDFTQLSPNANDLASSCQIFSSSGCQVSLSSTFNRSNGRVGDGTTFSATTGLDNVGAAYSGNLLNSPATWNSISFNLGAANASDVVSCAGQTITLPSGKFSSLRMLGTAVNGNQASQQFLITYTDNSTSTITQSVSDWFSPQNYGGETIVKSMAYRDLSNGTKDNRTFDLYGYSLGLNNTKLIKSIKLPTNANVEVLALTLVP